MKNTNKTPGFLGNLLFCLLIASHNEEYISEQGSKIVSTPAPKWHSDFYMKANQR